jgi:hypothetical protein
MELQEFVTETLVAIQKGVAEAITRAEEDKTIGAINPVWSDDKVDWKDHVQLVEFDVAVTATDKSSGGGKGSIKILSIAEVGAEGSKSLERSTVSRVKFSIPIVPPAKPTARS